MTKINKGQNTTVYITILLEHSIKAVPRESQMVSVNSSSENTGIPAACISFLDVSCLLVIRLP